MNVTEGDVLLRFLPHIKQICQGRWPNLEPEDREAEAAIFFVCALRSFPLNGGHFWEDYCAALTPYMNRVNQTAPSRYYSKEYSLDRPIRTNNSEREITLSDILVGSDYDESSLYVEAFIETRSEEEKAIIRELIDQKSRAMVARERKFPFIP